MNIKRLKGEPVPKTAPNLFAERIEEFKTLFPEVFKQNIPADALPIILEIYDHRPMTIRQARWVSKLYIAAHRYGYASMGNEPMLLYNLAAIYALREEAHELTKDAEVPCDTSDLDKLYLLPTSDIEEAVKLFQSSTRKAFNFLKEKQEAQNERSHRKEG